MKNYHLSKLQKMLLSSLFCLHYHQDLSQTLKVKSLSCVRLFATVDGSPPSSSVHGILQARILEWVAISFSRGSSRPRDRTQVSHITGRRFNLCTTREAPRVRILQLNSSSHQEENQFPSYIISPYQPPPVLPALNKPCLCQEDLLSHCLAVSTVILE